MKFIDEAKIEVHAGKGGDGSAAFRRERSVPRGGPSGGDGGLGGSVWAVADRNINTLIDYRYARIHRAENGDGGRGSDKYGRGDKIRIFKLRRRKHFQKTQGHRQNYTEVRIDDIVGGA